MENSIGWAGGGVTKKMLAAEGGAGLRGYETLNSVSLRGSYKILKWLEEAYKEDGEQQ